MMEQMEVRRVQAAFKDTPVLPLFLGEESQSHIHSPGVQQRHPRGTQSHFCPLDPCVGLGAPLYQQVLKV